MKKQFNRMKQLANQTVGRWGPVRPSLCRASGPWGEGKEGWA